MGAGWGVESSQGLGRRQGTLFPCREGKGHLCSVPGWAAQHTWQGAWHKEPSPGPVTGRYTEVGQCALCPSVLDFRIDFLELTISAPFFKLWPEGTLGTQRMIPVLSHPGTSHHCHSGWTEVLTHAVSSQPSERSTSLGALAGGLTAAKAPLWFMRKKHTKMR